ncbi:MAG: FAD-dependent oxidoreductase [Planctomycetota bacterium]|jgi:thioredoxin reductase (NADPH)
MSEETNLYDCIIIGAGPAGLAAGLYSSRDRLKTLILEKFYPGGQINNTDRIENYPGIEKISGPGLIRTGPYRKNAKPGTELRNRDKSQL